MVGGDNLSLPIRFKMVYPFPGPVPPYNNPPINPQYYKPRQFFISNIILGRTTLVTTVVDQDYEIGQSVRLLIPQTSGCYQLNEVQGIVLSIPMSNQVEVEIDSSKNVDSFVSSSASNQPQIVAIGDVNTGNISTMGSFNQPTYIPGSFINISPE